MKAIVDCNSFYASCERVFRPDLQMKPVVVLSNNDGCIVARSDEAKLLGVPMAGPYFQVKPLIEQYGMAVFSSNYHLYGDMSWRVMEILRVLMGGKGRVEVYSVDEAFIDIDEVAPEKIHGFMAQIRQSIEQWTGIAVSIGAAPTKTLAKMANRLSKKDKATTNCIVVLDTPEKVAAALKETPVEGIWGVGRKSGERLRFWGINSAWDLCNMSEEWAKAQLGGVIGQRLLRELKGEQCIVMEAPLKTKQMIMTSRMFGRPVNSLEEVKEAVATYATRAGEKLRRQHSAASVVQVFLSCGGHYGRGEDQGGQGHVVLPRATSFSNELIKRALEVTEQVFKSEVSYKKVGVILSGLVPDESIQANLFEPAVSHKLRFLMDAVDNVNFTMRDDILKFASSGLRKGWKMRQELRSPRCSTRWDELREVQ